MDNLVEVAGILTGIGTMITACITVVVYLLRKGNTEGGIKTDITNLTNSVNDLKGEVERGIAEVGARANEAHLRIDGVTDSHHLLREMIARDYVTYERMRELKTELSSSIDKMTRSHTDGMTAIHGRLDQLIHSIAKFGNAVPPPQASHGEDD